MGNALLQRIETWKKLLLDFGKRNRLINFKETKRSNVKITTPSYRNLFEVLAVQEKSLNFPFAKKVKIDEDGEEVYDAIVPGDMETAKSLGELQKTLKALRYKAITSIEEQGINILFLAFGLLKWTESDDSEQILISPLVLVPVKLTIESLTSPYILSSHEDEVVVNPTLSHKLNHDFGIQLPEFDSYNDDIEVYFSKIEKLINAKGWSIVRDVNLTTLSFLKINMYNDLERNQAKLNTNVIITAIAGETDSLCIPEGLDNYDHDNKTKPVDTFQVVDADSSQQDAILLSKKGVSFVLQGPPGTGKSQTITNIISEALAEGKKVLFVSEKMAALKVVYNRLSQVGLANFCLTMHSHKVNKKDILKDLSNSLSIDRKKVRDEALEQLDILEKKRTALNNYQRELHTRCSALNTTIYEINGALVKLDNAPEVIFEIESPEKITQTELNEIKYLISELSNIIGKRSEDYVSNIWRNTKIDYVSNKLRHDIDSNIPLLQLYIEQLNEIYSKCHEKLGLTNKLSINNLKWTVDLLSVLCDSPTVPVNWILERTTEQIVELEKVIHECISYCHNIVLMQDKITQLYDKEALALDYYLILKRFRGEYSSVFRVFQWKYHQDVNTLKSLLSSGGKLSYQQCIELLNNLKAIDDKKEELINILLPQKDILANYYNGYNTDWNVVLDSIDFTKKFKHFLESNHLPVDFIVKACDDKSIIPYCKSELPKLISAYDSRKQTIGWFIGLFDNSANIENLELSRLLDKLNIYKDNKHLLDEWVDYRSNRRSCEEKGLSDFLYQIEESSISADSVVNTYLKRFYHLWLDAVLPQFPAVQSFRGRVHNQTIKEFANLDRLQFKIAQSRIRERVCSRLPDFNSATSTKDEVGILKRELNKQRKIMPLRRLFNVIPNLLPALRPCFMMSPLSVSVFLEANSYLFDLVIFDEASQIHTEDAVGAIIRGKQVIVVGDTKQLPPTNFFSASIDDEDYDTDSDNKEDDTGAYQSILDESVTVLPERSLRWHYRSRHEHLIAFSNIKIYNNTLITFPSSIEIAPDCGVEYVHVLDGVYDRGAKRTNTIEAKRVAELVFEHFQKHSNRSLGIVTFSEAQQQAIDATIHQRRLEDTHFEEYFNEDRDEPFFIKNLETVQGDERDTIIFSIGYAKDSSGIMHMNFGPLSKDGGYRRLNVAITRAKYNIKLVGSIMPTDIDVERTSSEGVKLLRSYIEFAQQGIATLQKKLSYSESIEFDSTFEEVVYDFLTMKGYNVVTQVGCSDFRIDMAVKHPQYSGQFAIGIECDGAAYHSSRTARERDRLRQTILENMGWIIYRIWSTDWIRDQKYEEKKLVEAIEKALGRLNYINTEDFNDDTLDENVLEDIDEVDELSGITSKYNVFTQYEFPKIYASPLMSKTEALQQILHVLSPVHIEEVYKWMTPFYGYYNVTPTVREGVNDLLKTNFECQIIRKGDFIHHKDCGELKVKVDSSRPLKYVSPEEFELAIYSVAKYSFGIAPNDLIIATSRELGFKRTGEAITTALHKAYNNLLSDGKIKEIEGKVNVIQ